MNRFTVRLIIAALIFTLVGVAAIPLAKYFFASDRTRIERSIRSIVRGAEKSSPRRILKHFAPDFQQGEITRQFLEGYLRRFFVVFENVRPVVESIEIEVNGDRARAEVWAGCMVTPANRTKAESLLAQGNAGRFVLDFVKIEGRWYITHVDAPNLRLI